MLVSDRFSGYHTGTDFEIFSGEEAIDIEILAVCTGKLLTKATASGYGGYAVQSCEIKNEPVTVVYGHLRLSSISLKAGDTLEAGTRLGVLGTGESRETDGERKHLHLGIHKGTTINIKGYVSSQSQLAQWLDPMLYF